MSLLSVPIGANPPEVVNVVVEIPKGSTNKYEVDQATGMLRLDRVLHSPLFYPFDYGYIPQTLYIDGDPIDALVILSHPTFPGCVVEASPIGVLSMRDEKGQDEKILCVATKDPRYNTWHSLNDLNDHVQREISHFFEIYKALEDKYVEVMGWKDVHIAMALIEKYTLSR
jgi:inorganic pyrophosphatase